MPVAIVTGGNSGIGRASCVALAQAGFDIGLTWHSDEDRADSAAREIEHHGRRAQTRHADFADVHAGPRAVEELAEALGGLDVLVNNAGTGTSTPFVEMDLADWQHVLDVDLTTPFRCSQVAARRMIAAGGGGRIINVTSVHEHIPLDGSAPYTAAKHGLGGFTKVAAMELAEHGILVNAVAPGQIATRMTGQEDQEPEPSDGIPLGRAGYAHEIGAMVAWLAGEASSYVTGQSFVVDGGLTLIAARGQ